MQVTVSDVVGFIGLVVALNTALTGLILYVVRQDERRFRKTVKRLDRSEKLAEATVTLVTRCVFDLDGRLKVVQNQCQRLLVKSNVDALTTSRIVGAFAKLTVESQRKLQELALLSGDAQDGLSAGRQLSQLYGGIESIRTFELAIDREANTGRSRILKTYLRRMKKRLEG